MRVAPFYSFYRGMAVEDLWHDNDACEIGASIPAAERLPGEGSPAITRKHCQYCRVLNQPTLKARFGRS